MKLIGCTAAFALLLVTSLFTGCGDSHQPAPGAHKHHHDPPHGGTGVVLGNEDYHLELVLDASVGRMHAYILSAHMEKFVRIAAESFEVTAKLGDRQETLVFKAVADAATGEKVGDTSHFEAQAEWLKNTKTFDALLKNLPVRSRIYEGVSFNFPKGN